MKQKIVAWAKSQFPQTLREWVGLLARMWLTAIDVIWRLGIYYILVLAVIMGWAFYEATPSMTVYDLAQILHRKEIRDASFVGACIVFIYKELLTFRLVVGRVVLGLCVIFLVLGATTGRAQTAPPALEMPSVEQIESQQRATVETMRRLDALNPQSGKPKTAVPGERPDYQPQINKLMEQGAKPSSSHPSGASSSPHTSPSRADFERLVQQARGPEGPDVASSGSKSDDLLIFVSMSMPDAALSGYSEQAKRFGAVLVLRGFHEGKMSATQRKIVSVNHAKAQWDINPEPFKLFKVDRVPAIVLATSDSGQSLTEDGCAQPETYAVVYGDSSVRAALDKMAQRAQPAIASLAQARLDADRKTYSAR